MRTGTRILVLLGVWNMDQWLDFVSSARVNPALNEWLEKSGEGKQEGYATAQDGCPPLLALFG
jgi:hypothetical protein